MKWCFPFCFPPCSTCISLNFPESWFPPHFLLASSKGSMTCNIPGKEKIKNKTSKRNTARISRPNTIFCLWTLWPVQNPWTQPMEERGIVDGIWRAVDQSFAEQFRAQGGLEMLPLSRKAQSSCRISLVQCPQLLLLEALCSSTLDPNCWVCQAHCHNWLYFPQNLPLPSPLRRTQEIMWVFSKKYNEYSACIQQPCARAGLEQI